MKWRVGDLNGTVIAGVAGSPGSTSTQLLYPYGITLDQWKNLYVADVGNNRIQLFCSGNSTGITIARAGTGGTNLASVFDVKLDSQLNLYVSDFQGDVVIKFAKL
jgi:hypothetical protein